MYLRWLRPSRLLSGMELDGDCRWDNTPDPAPMPSPSTAGGRGDSAPNTAAPANDGASSDAEPGGAAQRPEAESDAEDDLFAPVTSTQDDDDDTHGRDPVMADPRVKKLRKDARRLARRLERQNQIAGALKGHDVRQLLTKAQQFDALAQAAATNPKLRAAIFGPAFGADEDSSPKGKASAEDDLNLDDLPFDTSDPVGKFFAERISRDAKTIKALTERLARIEGTLEQGTQQSQAAAARAETAAWKSAAEKAADQMPAEYRTMFLDAVFGAFSEAKRRGVQIEPQAVIDHYLKQARLTRAQTQRASDAAAQRIAEGNSRLPRPVTGGSPASGRPAFRTVAEVNRMVRRLHG